MINYHQIFIILHFIIFWPFQIVYHIQLIIFWKFLFFLSYLLYHIMNMIKFIYLQFENGNLHWNYIYFIILKFIIFRIFQIFYHIAFYHICQKNQIFIICTLSYWDMNKSDLLSYFFIFLNMIKNRQIWIKKKPMLRGPAIA